MNNKGFMMAELIVVSAVIIGTMSTFFVSYSKLLAKYNKLVNYYDVGTIYRLGNYYLKNKTNYVNMTNVSKGSETTEKINNITYTDTIYKGNCQYMKSYTPVGDDFMTDYFAYFKTLESIDDNKGCLVLKSCQQKDGYDKVRCKIGYLEVVNEEPK